MAFLTIIHNPFDPINSREIKEIESGKPIYATIDGFYCFFDVAVSVNGQITEDYEYIIKEDDHIGFVAIPEGGGGGKNIFATIAMVALVVAAPYMAGAAMGATAGMVGAGVYGGMMGAAIFAGLQMGIIYAGGMLINSLLPPEIPDFSNPSTDGIKSSPTYGWDGIQNHKNEGVALPIVYGKAKIVPPIISQYVETQDNKQYLNILMALNDGEIASVSDIKINNNPITYYDNVTYDVRLGTNSQTLIPSFDNTRVDNNVGVKLSTNETLRITQNNQVHGLAINVVAPNGIFFANDAGGFDSRTVDLVVKYRLNNPSETWQIIPNTTITGSSSSAIRKTFKVDNLVAGEYEVSVQRTRDESTSQRTNDKVYFESFTEIIYDDFTYPNTALLSIRALATDQLSGGMPTISAVVDSGNNFSNPALATANLLQRIGANTNSAKFSEWANFCTSNNYVSNIVFDSEIPVKDALNMLGLLGRANIVQIGSEYMPIIDKVETTSIQKFLFTMGNIIKDSFEETYLPLADRTNVVEITYFDENYDYERQTVELYQNGFDESTDTIRKSSLMLYGCTDRGQAIRHGRYLLNRNRYLTNTVSFEADVDAIACTVGDVIDVAHDVPQWGYSGRILEVNANTFKVDNPIPFEIGTNYQLTIRYSDDTILTVNLNPITTTGSTDTIEIPTEIITPLEPLMLYSIGVVNRTTKKFRVISITRASDQRRKISAIEYIPEVYTDATDTVNVIDYSALATVTALIADSITEVNASGYSYSVVTLSWMGNGLGWNVYYRSVGATEWIFAGYTTETNFRITDLPADEFEFKVGDKTTTINVVPMPKAPNIEAVITHKKYTGCQFEIQFTPFEDFKEIEIFEANVGGTITDAELIASTSERVYTRNGLNVVDSRNYWFRLVNKFGHVGDFFGPVIGSTETDISAVINEMKDLVGTEAYRPQLSDILVTGTVNGVNTLGLSGDLLVDGSIAANKLAVMGVSTFTNDAGYTDDTVANQALSVATQNATDITTIVSDVDAATLLAQQASLDAQEALASAGGMKAYYQTSAPISPNSGDLWIDSDANNKSYLFNGTTWDEVTITAGSGQNIANYLYSNFEYDATVGVPTFAKSATATTAISTSYPIFGTKSLQITASGADAYVFMGASVTDYNINLIPNKKWIVSAYVRVSSTNTPKTTNNIQLYIRSSAAGTYYGNTFSVAADTTTRIYGVYDLSADASTRCVLRIDNETFNSAGDTSIFIDGLMIEEYIGPLSIPSAYSQPTPSGDTLAKMINYNTTTIDGGKLTTNSIWVGGGIQSSDFTTIGGAGFRLKAGAAGTSADPTIYGAYIKGGTIDTSIVALTNSYGKRSFFTAMAFQDVTAKLTSSTGTFYTTPIRLYSPSYNGGDDKYRIHDLSTSKIMVTSYGGCIRESTTLNLYTQHDIEISVDGGAYYKLDIAYSNLGANKFYGGIIPNCTNYVDLRLKMYFKTSYTNSSVTGSLSVLLLNTN